MKEYNFKTQISIADIEKLQAKLKIDNLNIQEAELLEDTFTLAKDNLLRVQKYVNKRREDPYTITLNRINSAITYAKKTQNTDRLEKLLKEKQELVKKHKNEKESK